MTLSTSTTSAETAGDASISSSLQQMSGGLAAVVAGLIAVQAPGGALLHFDTLGYVLVCTTLVSLVFMYLIDRKIGDKPAGRTPVPEVAAVLE